MMTDVLTSPVSPSPAARSRAPMIVDAQVHVWLDSTMERPWPETGVEPQRVPALGVEELIREMDAAGVARALLVPPTWEGPRNDLVLSAVADHPDRFAALGRVDPTRPGTVAALPSWRSASGMLGIRLSVNRGDRAQQLRAGISSGFFAGAQRHGVPISLYMPGSFEEIGTLARLFPELRITVDHCALDSADLPLAAAIAPLLPLADLANVAVKASAFPCFVKEEYPFPSIPSAVQRLVGAFGAERVFWGSDLSRLPCTYSELVSAFVDQLDGLSDVELRLVMGEGLSAWLGWPQPPAQSSAQPISAIPAEGVLQ